MIIFTIPFAYLLYPKDFFIAWRYVTPLMISFIFGGLAGFLGSIFTAVKDTKIFSYSTMIGAVVNTVLNFILVYYMEIMGAAIATLISNVVIWLIRLHRSRRYICLKVNFLRHIFMYSLLIIQFGICLFGFGVLQVIFQSIILGVIIFANRKSVLSILRKLKAMLKLV